jgi:hypothetical protein
MNEVVTTRCLVAMHLDTPTQFVCFLRLRHKQRISAWPAKVMLRYVSRRLPISTEQQARQLQLEDLRFGRSPSNKVCSTVARPSKTWVNSPRKSDGGTHPQPHSEAGELTQYPGGESPAVGNPPKNGGLHPEAGDTPGQDVEMGWTASICWDSRGKPCWRFNTFSMAHPALIAWCSRHPV